MTRLAFLLAAGLVCAGGCGSKTATVTGTVTVGGKPLAAGTVQVKDATGEVRLGAVADGRFTVDGVARGPAKLAVVPGVVGAESKGPSRAFGQYGRGRAKGEEPVAVVPAEHQRPETSPHAVQVDRGTVTVEIAIP